MKTWKSGGIEFLISAPYGGEWSASSTRASMDTVERRQI
jgi:hypothetical protein